MCFREVIFALLQPSGTSRMCLQESLFFCCTPTFDATSHPRPVFPPEIIDKITVAILSEDHSFSSIANLSLASYQFRQVAFRRYFVRLSVLSQNHWVLLCQIPGIFSWVYELECLSVDLHWFPQNISQFKNLRDIAISFCPEGLNTQQNRINQIFRYLPSRLSSLTLTFLPRLDVDLLSLIASLFPGLHTLILTCTERVIEECCWFCYEEASGCTIHSPIPDAYIDADDLTYAFGSALAPLKQLQTLHLGIFLSEFDILYAHITRHCPDQQGRHIITNHDTCGPYWKPFGPDECEICQDEYADTVRKTELFASAAIARFIPSLKEVSWSTFFAKDEPGDDPENQTMTAWVQRKDGKIRVRRMQWYPST